MVGLYLGDESEKYVEQEISSEEEENNPMAGFGEEDDPEECVECGGAIRDKKVSREVDEETLNFCSKLCAEDFEESTI